MTTLINTEALRNDFISMYRDDYKNFIGHTSLEKKFRCLMQFNNGYDSYISFEGVSDDDINKSIVDFFEIMSEHPDAAKYVDKLINFIKNGNDNPEVPQEALKQINYVNNTNTDEAFKNNANEDRIVRYIADFYYGKLKMDSFWKQVLITKPDENGNERSVHKEIDGDDWKRSCLDNLSQEDVRIYNPQLYFQIIGRVLQDEDAKTATIIKVLTNMLNATKDLPDLKWYNICKFLWIRNNLRNAVAAHSLDIEKIQPNDRISVVKFILYSYLTTCLALRKCLAAKKAFKEEEENVKWNIRFVLYNETERQPNIQVEPENGKPIDPTYCSKSRIEYTLDATCKYKITIDGHSFGFMKLPTNGFDSFASWNGTKLSTAANATNDPHGAPVVLGEVYKTLTGIEENTDETAKNTGEILKFFKVFFIVIVFVGLGLLALMLCPHFQSPTDDSTISMANVTQTFNVDVNDVSHNVVYYYDSIGKIDKIIPDVTPVRIDKYLYEIKTIRHNDTYAPFAIYDFNVSNSAGIILHTPWFSGPGWEEIESPAISTTKHLMSQMLGNNKNCNGWIDNIDLDTLDISLYDYRMSQEDEDMENFTAHITKWKKLGEKEKSRVADGAKTIIERDVSTEMLKDTKMKFTIKYSDIKIPEDYRAVIFCPEAFECVFEDIPSTAYRNSLCRFFCIYMGQNALHIPEQCSIEIIDAKENNMAYEIFYHGWGNKPSKKKVTQIYKVFYAPESSIYGSNSLYKTVTYTLTRE